MHNQIFLINNDIKIDRGNKITTNGPDFVYYPK